MNIQSSYEVHFLKCSLFQSYNLYNFFLSTSARGSSFSTKLSDISIFVFHIICRIENIPRLMSASWYNFAEGKKSFIWENVYSRRLRVWLKWLIYSRLQAPWNRSLSIRTKKLTDPHLQTKFTFRVITKQFTNTRKSSKLKKFQVNLEKASLCVSNDSPTILRFQTFRTPS